MSRDNEQCCLTCVRKTIQSDRDLGLTDDEVREVAALVEQAEPNPDANKFPDFISPAGFIEHFQITSSNDNRKGSTHERGQAEFHREWGRKEAEFMESVSVIPGEVESLQEVRPYPEHSYKNLVTSFQKHWVDHIDSLRSSDWRGKTGAFMVQYTDWALEQSLYDSSYLNRTPTSHVSEYYPDFHLDKDRALLNFILGYVEEVRYVFYVGLCTTEIISVKSIPEVVATLLPECCVGSRFSYTRAAAYGWSMPGATDTDRGWPDEQG